MSYIRQYSKLTPQELRQLRYKRRYKQDIPDWDDSMVYLTNLVRERIIGKPIILDFGCGRGNFVIDELKGRFAETIGFDVAQESVDGNTGHDRIVIGTPGGAFPLADASIDMVVSLWVFEHVQDPEAIMKDIYRVLKPGGVFAFVTPNRNSLLIRLRRLLSDNIAHRLLKSLYGREEKDVFEVYYRANTVNDVKRLSQAAALTPEIVIENADPSYTSFDESTYQLSKLFTRWIPSLANPHLIAILKKRA